MVTIDVMDLESLSVKYLCLYNQVRRTVERLMNFFFFLDENTSLKVQVELGLFRDKNIN